MSASWSSETEQVHAVAAPGPARLSVGSEGVADIDADLDSGFRAAKGA